MALKNGTVIRGGSAKLEGRLREILGLAVPDSAVYLPEAATILGLAPKLAAQAIAAAGLHQDASTVGVPRWRRSEIERLRGRLLAAPSGSRTTRL